MIGDQHAVKVVYLMLNDTGQQAIQFLFDRPAFEVKRPNLLQQSRCSTSSITDCSSDRITPASWLHHSLDI